MFHPLGGAGFASRATPDDGGDPALTPQEAEIAALASEGLSHPEIGARLFTSRRTVQYHRRKVVAKLGITPRAQLPVHNLFTASGSTAVPLSTTNGSPDDS